METGKYAFEGNYTHNGRLSDIEGSFEIGENNGDFKGQIRDHGSRFPEQQIDGNFTRRESGLYVMQFLKFPPNQQLANLLYVLEQQEKEEGISGTYEGKWVALAEAITLQVGGQIFSTLRIPEGRAEGKTIIRISS